MKGVQGFNSVPEIFSQSLSLIIFSFFLSRYNNLNTQLDMKSREAELVEERLKQSTHHQKVEELDSYRDSVGMSTSLFYRGKSK